jgi:hypothetical protein
MQLSDTTNKNGLIQECEFWCRFPDGGISGVTFLLAQFVNRINRAYDRVLPLIYSQDDTLQFDDPNHTKLPFARFNLVSGQGDYNLVSDEQGNSILNIVKIFILQSATATEYVEIDRVPVGTDREQRILNPATAFSGIPSEFVELGGSVFLGPIPNYNATLGGKVMLERSPNYFTVATLTRTPGIPEPYHPLLALHASADWLAVNKPDNTSAIAIIRAEIEKAEKKLASQNRARFPKQKRVMSGTSSQRSI